MDHSRISAEPVMHCARHPSTVTYLRCASCNTPICPRCLVMTPVGAKCPDCARVRLNAAFQFRPLDALLGVVICLVGGVALGLLASVLAFALAPLRFLFDIFFPFAAGLLLADGVRRVIPRRRSVILSIFLGVGVVLAWVSYALGDFLVHGPLALIQSGMLPLMVRNLGMSAVLNPLDLLFVGVGIWIGIHRLNN